MYLLDTGLATMGSSLPAAVDRHRISLAIVIARAVWIDKATIGLTKKQRIVIGLTKKQHIGKAAAD